MATQTNTNHRVFPASKIVPLLRALADPEGKGEVPPERARWIEQVASNVKDA
jgi:hypothetical protein